MEKTVSKIVAVQAGMNGLIEMLAGLVIGLVVLYAGWRNFSFGDTPGQFSCLHRRAPDGCRSPAPAVAPAAATRRFGVGAQMIYDLLDMPAAEKPAPQLAVRGSSCG